MSFSGKIAIVTGGGSGLGAELGRQLEARGATVVLCDIKPKDGVVRADVTDKKAMSEFIRAVRWRYGKLDYIFNNAGVLRYEEILGSDLANWQQVIDVDLMGVVIGSLEAYTVMAEQGFGHIVNIGSMSAISLFPLFAAYTSAKTGVLAFSRMLRLEAESHGVKVTVACPGNIRTGISTDYKPSVLTPAISVEDAVQRILRGVERNRAILAFPFHARLYWWLDRLHPHFLDPLRRIILKRYRERTRTRKPEQELSAPSVDATSAPERELVSRNREMRER